MQVELQDRESAREIQGRFFPGCLQHIHCLDYYGDCQPAGDVGGDFFDFIPLGNETLFVSVGDVSGKGFGAAIMMAGLQAFLRGFTAQKSLELSTVVREVNRLAYDVSPDNFYATWFYGRVDPLRRQLRYVSAGHEPALLARKNCSRIHRLESTGTVLGVSSLTAFGTKTLMLEPGDVLVVFTDGITEAVDAGGRELCETGVLELLRRYPDARASDLVGEIMQAASRFANYSRPGDDRTVVVVRYTGAAEDSAAEDRFTHLTLAAA